MKLKQFFILLAFVVCSTAQAIEEPLNIQNIILKTWSWEKSVGGSNNPYTSTPKSTGYHKKIVFTVEGRIITFKDNVEIRNSTYEIKKGISVIDHLEHTIITFEGQEYIIENIDNQNLTLLKNNLQGDRITFKKSKINL